MFAIRKSAEQPITVAPHTYWQGLSLPEVKLQSEFDTLTLLKNDKHLARTLLKSSLVITPPDSPLSPEELSNVFVDFASLQVTPTGVLAFAVPHSKMLRANPGELGVFFDWQHEVIAVRQVLLLQELWFRLWLLKQALEVVAVATDLLDVVFESWGARTKVPSSLAAEMFPLRTLALVKETFDWDDAISADPSYWPAASGRSRSAAPKTLSSRFRVQKDRLGSDEDLLEWIRKEVAFSVNENISKLHLVPVLTDELQVSLSGGQSLLSVIWGQIATMVQDLRALPAIFPQIRRRIPS